jgi:hypothetical protein
MVAADRYNLGNSRRNERGPSRTDAEMNRNFAERVSALPALRADVAFLEGRDVERG